MDETNIEVKLADDILTIKGEKKEEKEAREKDYYLSGAAMVHSSAHSVRLMVSMPTRLRKLQEWRPFGDSAEDA
jgi:HSP20 family molecular chaperone IbpA